MKSSSSLAFIAAFLAAPAAAVEYTVSTCADLADVDDTLATGLTIDSSTFACDEYTRFRVRNTMSLKATVPAVEFSNFSLKVLGELTVEPDVVFSGVVEETVNGGVLSVVEGATATFMGAAQFSDNSIAIKQIGPVSCGDGCTRTGRGLSYVVKKGGAVHNKGMLTFEGRTIFLRNSVVTDDSVEQGKAGALSNTGSGRIWFKGFLTVEENEAEGFFEGLGGGFYNRGEIIVDNTCFFGTNQASNGGAIYNTKIGKLTFNAEAEFYANTAFDLEGGAIHNAGGVVDFNAGSDFEANVASGSGDGGRGGALYNGDGGVITLTGENTFKFNSAFWGGAIYNNVRDDPETSIIYPDGPDDLIFRDNTAENCPDVNNANVFDGDNENCPVVF